MTLTVPARVYLWLVVAAAVTVGVVASGIAHGGSAGIPGDPLAFSGLAGAPSSGRTLSAELLLTLAQLLTLAIVAQHFPPAVREDL
ncbi:MAG TPA: hypothetical protein VGW38_17480 [Chloroflexota bacterium]|nr:hypothetical protein [Chloroflexota bacterium]